MSGTKIRQSSKEWKFHRGSHRAASKYNQCNRPKPPKQRMNVQPRRRAQSSKYWKFHPGSHRAASKSNQ